MSDESKKLEGPLSELHSGDADRNVVLCVDDDRAVRKLLSRFISRLLPNFKVETANCPDDAISQISNALTGHVALVFSDMEMGHGKNGMDFANALRGEEADPNLKKDMENVPVVISSGNYAYGDPSCEEGQAMQALLDKGVVDVFAEKPFYMSTIQNAVKEAIELVNARIAERDQKIQ